MARKKKLPIIISAPHACSVILARFTKRMKLSPEQIWRCSDPFTKETCQYPRAHAIYVSKNHRLLGDLNRPPTADTAFQTEDFYGNSVWKKGKELSQLEKAELLGRYWFPHYEGIVHDMHSLFDAGHKKVLFIDHHNTAVDHPLGKSREYLPSIEISNLGSRHRGAKLRSGNATSMPAAAMKVFQKALREETHLGTEVNSIFRGGYGINWVTQHGLEQHSGCKVYAVQLEYNLNLIHNPLSGRNDLQALEKLRDGINKAIDRLTDYLKLG